jgi:carbon-monoxide dehydrogenase large subunit
MGMEGIGASVVRKEDKRFITGKGRYVDDIKLRMPRSRASTPPKR